MTVAALFVEAGGCYADLPDVDPWSEDRDARTYAGPYPVVAHPPCQRWGRFWHGSPLKPHRFKLGDDGGCFATALGAVRRWGGVLEHPADSAAWKHFDLIEPTRSPGWVVADWQGGWTCYVEQGHYGHLARKGTWLYAHGVDLPSLRWGRLPQRLDPLMVERHGYEYARRKGLVSMVGGKRKTEIRNATPPEFRDLLLSIARGRVMKPLARKRGDGWVAAVTLADGKVRVLDREVYPKASTALLHATLWLSKRAEKEAWLARQTAKAAKS